MLFQKINIIAVNSAKKIDLHMKSEELKISVSNRVTQIRRLQPYNVPLCWSQEYTHGVVIIEAYKLRQKSYNIH